MDGTKEWWASKEADEVMPEAFTSPNDAIIGRDGDQITIGRKSDEHDGWTWNAKVKIGHIENFISREDMGRVPVKFKQDGTFEALSEVPECNHCWIPYNIDTIAESLELLAEMFKEGYLQVEYFEEVSDVDFSDFSEEIPHQLIESDGKFGCSFVPVKQGNA